MIESERRSNTGKWQYIDSASDQQGHSKGRLLPSSKQKNSDEIPGRNAKARCF